jgi:hypothetical protein
VGDQIEKVQINTEFFYNGDGYKNNFLDDATIYPFDSSVTLTKNGQSVTVPSGYRAYYLLGKNLYAPNYFSRYYAALFTTINKFFIDELSLAINCIGNLEQKSFIVSTGLNYANINDFKMGITVDTFLGKKNTEYTFSGNAYDVMLTAGIVF